MKKFLILVLALVGFMSQAQEFDFNCEPDLSAYNELTIWGDGYYHSTQVQINITDDGLASKLVRQRRYGADAPYRWRHMLIDSGSTAPRTGYRLDYHEVDNSFRVYNGTSFINDYEYAESLDSQDLLDAINSILERYRTEFGY